MPHMPMRRASAASPVPIDEFQPMAAADSGDMVEGRLVADYFAGENEYGSSGASLQKYFDAYTIAARAPAQPSRRM